MHYGSRATLHRYKTDTDSLSSRDEVDETRSVIYNGDWRLILKVIDRAQFERYANAIKPKRC